MRTLKDLGEDVPTCWVGEMGLSAHGKGLGDGRAMDHEGVSKAAPGHHRVIYFHEANIQAMHRVGTAADEILDDEVVGSVS